MGEAAKISLKAIGKQDTYLLSKDPDDSFFNDTDERRHSEFRKYHRNRNVINPGQELNWPFGQTIKVEYKPQNMGDLLSNMWLTITVPGLENANYADQLGRHLLKSVTMFVDEIEVEKIDDDWGIIYDELYLEMSEKVANRFLVNRNIAFDSSIENWKISKSNADLVIPIHFFFSRKFSSDEYATNKPNRPYFPLCAIHRQKIIFELEFHKHTFFTDSVSLPSISSFNLVTEEITINTEERNYFANEPQTLITDLVRKHPTTVSEIGKETIRTNLVPNIPVKCFHWFLRNTVFENEDVSIDTSTSILGEPIEDVEGPIALSRDGTTLAIGLPTGDGIVRVFTEAWTQLGQDIEGTTNNNLGSFVALSADGKIIAITSPGNSSVRVYEYKNENDEWEQLGTDISGGDSDVVVSLSDDGKRIAIATPNENSGTVRVFGYETVTLLSWSIIGAVLTGSSVALSGDGNILVVGAETITKVFSIKTIEPPSFEFVQLGSDIDFGGLDVAIATIDSFRDVAITSVGKTKVFTLDENDEFKLFGQEIDSGGSSISISQDGLRIAFVNDSSTVEVYDFRYDQWIKATADISGGTHSLSGDGLRIATVNDDSAIVTVLPSVSQGDFLFHNRFNFSSQTSFDQIEAFFNPIMFDAAFYINGTRLRNVTRTTHPYYKYLIPFRNRLARPIRNVYTYSFSMYPINVEPSGNLDFSQIQSEKTSLEVNMEKGLEQTGTYALVMYYTGYQTFTFTGGFMKVAS